jgi:SAM-dependent methyltransferase
MDYAENYERCCLERQTAFQKWFITIMTRKAQALGHQDHKIFSMKYVIDHYLAGQEGLRVLDCGAWNGWFLSYNIPAIAQRIALDFDSHFAAQFRKDGIDFVLSNMEKGHFPLSDDSMDLVAMTSTLEHLDCPETIATEIHRTLKPSGIVFITVPDIRKYKFNFWNDVTHKRPFTDKSLRFLFETHGMETLHLSSYNHNLFIAGHLFPPAIHRRLMQFRGNSLMYIGRKPPQ